MRTTPSTVLALTLAATPATVSAGETPAAATTPTVTDGEDVPKPDPAPSELFLLGVGVTYGRTPATPGHSNFLKPADDGASLSPAIAFEWRR